MWKSIDQTTKVRRHYLVSEPNYYATKIFSDNVLAIEMKRTKIFISKPVVFDKLILKISKIVIYEF